MIKIDIDMEHNTVREISCEGNILMILSELSFAMGQIYNDVRSINPHAGETFRSMVIRSWGDPTNPMWALAVDGQTTKRCQSVRIDEDLIRRAMGGEQNDA